MAKCKECKKELSCDEAAIYRRLIYRDATEYLCIDCLAKELMVDRKVIEEKIKYFKSIGCTLF